MMRSGVVVFSVVVCLVGAVVAHVSDNETHSWCPKLYGSTAFEKAINRDQFYGILEGGLGLSYKGFTGRDAANAVYNDISCTQQLHGDIYGAICGFGTDLQKKNDCAGFASMASFVTNRFHTPMTGDLQQDYCSQKVHDAWSYWVLQMGHDYDCKGNQHYSSRMGLKWNYTFGKVSQLIYGDRHCLLNSPDIVGFNEDGYMAMMQMWLLETRSGGRCPFADKGDSCYFDMNLSMQHAMILDSYGFGYVMAMLDTPSCCPTGDRRRILPLLEKYLNAARILDLRFDLPTFSDSYKSLPVPAGSLGDCHDGRCLTNGCPLVYSNMGNGCSATCRYVGDGCENCTKMNEGCHEPKCYDSYIQCSSCPGNMPKAVGADYCERTSAV